MRPEKILSIFAVAALYGMFSPSASAQDGEGAEDYSNRQLMLEEIIVTATRREANVQDVPLAISVFSEQMMVDIGAESFGDLVNHIAGVEYRTFQAGRGSIAMRGIAEQDAVFGGPGVAVGLYLDELPLSMGGLFPDIKSFDIARVEVLRGPQGTIFGEGSMAGTIRLISNKPDPAGFSGKAELTYSDTRGGDSSFIGNAALNIPLGDTMALRVSAYYNDMGGYIDAFDFVTGEPTGDDVNSSKTTGGRFVLGWAPTDKLDITLSALINTAEQGAYNQADKDYQQVSSILSKADDELDAYNLTIEYDFGFADLVSSTSYFERELSGLEASDGIVPIVRFIYGLFGLPSAGPITSVWIDRVHNAEAFSQELRLVSNSSGKLQWTAGAFYKEQDYASFFTGESIPDIPEEEIMFVSMMLVGIPMTENMLSDNSGTYEQIAAFGEVSYDFTDNFQALIGARIFREDRKSTTRYAGLFPVLLGSPPGEFLPPVVSEGRSNVFNPRLTLTYSLESQAILYGTVSQGFRSGGQNDFFVLVPGASPDFDPETLTNYEIGFKSAWMDNRLVFNVAAYYMDWKDLQAVTVESAGGAFETTDNVGDAHSLGVDLELIAEPVDGLVLSASATFLEAQTDDDFILDDPSGAPGIAPKGTRIPRVAETTFNISGQYNFRISSNLGGFARLSYAYVGDSIDLLVNPITVESYQIVNARLGVESGRWAATLFADNLTDEFIIYGKSRQEPPTPWIGQTWTVGRPRTIGVSLRFNF